MTDRQWERIAAVLGLVFVGLLVATLFTPSTPDLDDAVAQIASELREDATGHELSVYLGGLAAIVFVGFAGGLWSLLTRAGAAGAALVMFGGAVALALGVLIANGVYYSLVTAAEERREPEAIRALAELDNGVFLGSGFAFPIFFGAAALAVLASRGLPRTLGWAAAVLAMLFAVGLLGLFSEDEEGGPLGILAFIAFLGSLVWALAASTVMLRHGRPRTTT